VDNYVAIYKAVTGNDFSKEELIRQSERVYNFQRILNIRLGKGLRKHDAQPYRAAGPVTEEEYLSRQERYDGQLIDLIGMDPSKMTLQEKMKATRAYREDRYEQLLDAVYARRGWNKNGVPTLAHIKDLGMDFPEVLEVITPLQ
jgi:aldehyde:ferredoxin oxidoreductase